MNKKTVELKSKKKVQIREMLEDEMDDCKDLIIYHRTDDGKFSHFTGLSKSRTAWLRRGIVGGDFKKFESDEKGYPTDSVLKELSDDEKNELTQLIQDYQSLGE
tara:strand:+ start:2398 stop:2709 length:312 start_codon:yes stop_codon:yes gene_type:complete